MRDPPRPCNVTPGPLAIPTTGSAVGSARSERLSCIVLVVLTAQCLALRDIRQSLIRSLQWPQPRQLHRVFGSHMLLLQHHNNSFNSSASELTPSQPSFGTCPCAHDPPPSSPNFPSPIAASQPLSSPLFGGFTQASCVDAQVLCRAEACRRCVLVHSSVC